MPSTVDAPHLSDAYDLSNLASEHDTVNVDSPGTGASYVPSLTDERTTFDAPHPPDAFNLSNLASEHDTINTDSPSTGANAPKTKRVFGRVNDDALPRIYAHVRDEMKNFRLPPAFRRVSHNDLRHLNKDNVYRYTHPPRTRYSVGSAYDDAREAAINNIRFRADVNVVAWQVVHTRVPSAMT
jgi:hypothetical protein